MYKWSRTLMEMETGGWKLRKYWPSSLFSLLSSSASTVQWGGEVKNLKKDGQQTTTQMGSGHFPEEGPGKASFFDTLNVIDGKTILRRPWNSRTVITNPNCYNIINSGDYFYYGGPGRNPNCPWSFRLLFQNKEKEGNHFLVCFMSHQMYLKAVCHMKLSDSLI